MTTKEIAEQTEASLSILKKWASTNGVEYVGEGMRKTYVWKESDFERFKNRNTTVGRPKKEKKF